MKLISTRNTQIQCSITDAIHQGLAHDGGLFVPEYFPQYNLQLFSKHIDFPLFAYQLLQPFFKQDALDKHLLACCHDTFTFKVPLNQLDETTYLLELYHGPTASFKDFGARFLAACLSASAIHHNTLIMVATSGDTGSAVASAFYLKPKMKVIILYPKDKISERQEKQIICWGKNIIALPVEGNFDKCQTLVKSAFQDPFWQGINSANSINIGRLLPQITYYAYASLTFYCDHQKAPGFIVPSGNLGNAVAAYWAKKMGFPIREIVLATNANRVIDDYLQSGIYQPRTSKITLANAMDVGAPSNFERLQNLFHSHALFKKNVQTFFANDTDIQETIKAIYERYHLIICPHTATAFFARQKLSNAPWIIVATAHPSKFDSIIEPIIQTQIAVPPTLQQLLDKPAYHNECITKLSDIKKILKSVIDR